MKFKILIVDDETNLRTGLIELLSDDYEVQGVANGTEAIQKLADEEFDLVLSDVKMSPTSGEALLHHIVTNYPTISVIMFTGHGTVKNAVDAMHKGAFDYVSKPINISHLQKLIRRALQGRSVSLKNRAIDEELSQLSDQLRFITKNKQMIQLLDNIKFVAPTNSVVLLTGESGVGKEVLCNRIHSLSTRNDKPIVSVHCAALSESLLESELFGHEKGSFTGAISQRKGRFELANGGTIFLDEVGEIDKNIQVKLLRVLQEKSFERVGGEESISVDVRIIAATNRNLRQEVDKGNFREDLYYRLNVVHFEVPSLSDRPEDVLLYAQHFLQQFLRIHNKQHIQGFSKKVLLIFAKYHWPGNIRELRNCVERSVIITRSKIIDVNDLPDEIREEKKGRRIEFSLGTRLDEVERVYIQCMLDYCEGNKSETAKILGIGRKTLHNKINKYNLL